MSTVLARAWGRRLGFCVLTLWLGLSTLFPEAQAKSVDRVPVGITYYAPDAKNVAVAGSFDPWWQKIHTMTRGPDGRWAVVLRIPPGRYEFHFLVDEKWRYDPRLPSVSDGLGGHNNVLVVFPR